MDLASYLELSDPDIGCTVLVDNAMTAKLISGDPAAAWELTDSCPECLCEGATSGLETIEAAPWYRADVPASAEFYGLYGRLRLSQPTATTVISNAGVRQIAPARQVVFSGIAAGSSARGTAYGLEWVRNWLEPMCTPCAGRELTVQMWCPDDVCDDETGLAMPDPEADPAQQDWTLLNGLNCDVADPLDLTPSPVQYVDNGVRVLPDVDYVVGSFVEIPDGNAPIPACHGARVTFTFQVNTDRRYLPSTSGGSFIVGPQDGDPEPCCTGVSWDMGDVEADCGCGVACECSVETVLPATGAVDVIPDGAAICRYSAPLCAQQFALLTETFVSGTAVPTVSITAGSTDMYNVAVTIWEAQPGLADPTTYDGFLQYEQRAPVVDPALIFHIPAQSTFTLNGLDETETVLCAGDRSPTASAAMRCGGLRYQHPTLCCGRRYWVAIETACDQPGDWRMDVTINGVERV